MFLCAQIAENSNCFYMPFAVTLFRIHTFLYEHTEGSIENLREIQILSSQVSTVARAPWRKLPASNSASTTRFASWELFQHAVKRNRTFTRRKCIIPPTFPPYKDARRGHNGAAPSRTFAHHLSRGKTSFLLLSIDAERTRSGKL